MILVNTLYDSPLGDLITVNRTTGNTINVYSLHCGEKQFASKMQMRTFNGFLWVPVRQTVDYSYIVLVSNFQSNSVLQINPVTFSETSLASTHSPVSITMSNSYTVSDVVENPNFWGAIATRFHQPLSVNSTNLTFLVNYHTTTFPYNISIDGPCSDFSS